ncbi:MAG: YeaH/YhbH family protein [Halofilum sp. (in: g-proteobacteria)]|nr:YeaH/YhbH family protein [Halofilum sp. (in: g-proteobacteria)]
MNLERTMRHSMARRVALGRPTARAVEALEAELAALRAGEIRPADGREPATRIAEIEEMLARAHERRRKVPFIDPIDLRYSHVERVPRPVTQAVMFCLMDVSASMDERMKDLAKRFFILLHLFLKRQYERVDVVFIRHTQHAQEVDEDTFFHGRQTGGTIVSSAFEEMLRVVADRYPVADWNLYLAQASDGDDWRQDLERCARVLAERVLPLCQYGAYVEIARTASPGAGADPLAAGASELWQAYDAVAESQPHFARRRIAEPGDIYPVFRDLFRREGVEA